MAGWRYMLQALPSGGWLDRDVPLSNVAITSTLSGPGRLTGTIPVEVASLVSQLTPWGCALWAEASGQIRGGGILTPVTVADQALTVDCVGISGYPQGMPWTGDPLALVGVDPLAVVRTIWDHLQDQPGGGLGVVVDGTTSPVRVGTAATDDDRAEPLELNWWATHDLGRVLDDLAANTPFDYREETAWASVSSDTLTHRLRLGYPTLGVRRPDLRLAVGENVTVVPTLDAEDDAYASDVLALGAGEGRAMVRTQVRRTGATGLRRVAVVIDKTATSRGRLATAARATVAGLDGAPRLHDLTVTDHPHAPLGALSVGDEVFVAGSAGWVDLDRWVRITELTIRPDQGDRIDLQVQEV